MVLDECKAATMVYRGAHMNLFGRSNLHFPDVMTIAKVLSLPNDQTRSAQNPTPGSATGLKKSLSHSTLSSH
jgi:hypothetical protein